MAQSQGKTIETNIATSSYTLCSGIMYLVPIAWSGLHVIITWVYTAELALAWSQ